MKSLLTSLAILTASLSLVGSVHAETNADKANLTCPTQADSYLSVVGVQGANVHTRMELRDLEKDPTMWNLFLQAFAKFQAMDQTDKTSYFQIAGIHGAPFVSWDRVEGTGQLGYCPHGSNLFGTWHRPYLALFDQILHNRAKEIADEFPEGRVRREYRKAARRLRLPFWDWAIDPPNNEEGCMPESLRRLTASITLPNGTTTEIPNPLLSYRFHPLNEKDFDPLAAAGFKFHKWQQTIRFPEDGFSDNATSRNNEVNERITNQQVNNRDMLYKLLTIYQPFNEWSNKANGGKIGNIETLHDGIHNSFGLGNMGIVEVSAFDPVFWFHHCNIDRIMAIYQHRYPETYLEPSKQAKASFTTTKDSVQDGNSPLSPFRMNANPGTVWTSNLVRDWEHFGYTYPELKGKPSNESLTITINRMYQKKSQGLQNSTNSQSVRFRARNGETKKADAWQWMAEVNLPSDIQTTYSVRAFLGAPDADPKKWATDPNYVGQVASLASPRLDMDSDIIVTANIALTNRLQDKFEAGEIKSLERHDVRAYLKENFFWRIQKADSTEISRGSPPAGLNCTVFSVPVHLPESEIDVPTFAGDFEYDGDIDGRPQDVQRTKPKPLPSGYRRKFAA